MLNGVSAIDALCIADSLIFLVIKGNVTSRKPTSRAGSQYHAEGADITPG